METPEEKPAIIVAPIHAKLELHRKNPSIAYLVEVVDEHHKENPPAFVWAPDLLAVLQFMQEEIDELKKRVSE